MVWQKGNKHRTAMELDTEGSMSPGVCPRCAASMFGFNAVASAERDSGIGSSPVRGPKLVVTRGGRVGPPGCWVSGWVILPTGGHETLNVHL